jgi:hypothetical protein
VTAGLRAAGRVPAALVRRAGRRGAFLGFLAVLSWAYGYSLFTTAAPQQTLDLLLPWEAWGGIWIGTGTVCAAGVLARRDRAAFTAAAVLFCAWGMLYAQLWLIQHVPRAWVAVIIWFVFAATVLVVCGWPEPARLAPPRGPEGSREC